MLREPFNTISHAVGAVAALAGLVGLILIAEGARQVVAVTVYGSTLVLLFLASSLYHGIPASDRVVRWLQRMDHAAIYIFIAGTYTPVALVTVGGTWGWSLFGIIWGIAVAGVATHLTLPIPPRWLSATLYVGMGWLAVIAFKPLMEALPPVGIAWLVAGGLVYTLGAVVYALKWPKLWPGRFGSHELWHLFVLVGSLVHFIFIARYAL